MKIILSGGGTGGHIYPALTLADTIRELEPEAEIRFVGTRHGLEKDLVPRAGYPIDFIDVQGFGGVSAWTLSARSISWARDFGRQSASWTSFARTWSSARAATCAAPSVSGPL